MFVLTRVLGWRVSGCILVHRLHATVCVVRHCHVLLFFHLNGHFPQTSDFPNVFCEFVVLVFYPVVCCVGITISPFLPFNLVSINYFIWCVHNSHLVSVMITLVFLVSLVKVFAFTYLFPMNFFWLITISFNRVIMSKMFHFHERIL